ncbi:methyl-accepting chemotaxis protein [Halalkalibacter sp. AB-rgal2]|uniref:methyl-accepting chemotaxis protein n=1 Tax=Halalkalibacter sp. AB-rgal2 TaxID=3242695 RepID=UPI00359EB368
MNLQKKLLFSFLGVILVCLGLLSYAIYNLTELNRDANTIYHERLVPTKHLVDLARLTENTNFLMVQSIINEDPSLTNEAIQNLDEISMILDEYVQMPLTAHERELFEQFSESWSSFERRVRNNRGLISSQRYDDAREGLNGGMQLFESTSTDLMALVEINDTEAEQLLKANNSSYQLTVGLSIILTIVIVSGSVIYALFFSRYLSSNLKKITQRLNAIAMGDLTGEPMKLKSKDELSTLAQGLHSMQEQLRQLILKTSEASHQVSASSEQMSASSEQSSRASEQMTQLALNTSEGADKQLQSINQVSSSLTQMNGSLQQIAHNSHEMASYSEKTAKSTDYGSKAIQLVNAQMNAIAESMNDTSASVTNLGKKSAEIGEIIHLITGISEQTNLLALNAAIEAARAGEHGKGFAVVADEVRKLAEESGKSANKIYEMISNMQEETDRVVSTMESGNERFSKGVAATDQVTNTFSDIKASVEIVTAKVQEVSASIQEMTSVSEYVLTSVESIQQIAELNVESSQENSASSQQQLATMEEIASSASSLAHLAEELQQSIQKFNV